MSGAPQPEVKPAVKACRDLSGNTGFQRSQTKVQRFDHTLFICVNGVVDMSCNRFMSSSLRSLIAVCLAHICILDGSSGTVSVTIPKSVRSSTQQFVGTLHTVPRVQRVTRTDAWKKNFLKKINKVKQQTKSFCSQNAMKIF